MAYNGVVAVAVREKEQILERMSRGEAITDIARDLGYSTHAGIANRLGDDPEFKKALRHGVRGKIEKREKELESATDNVAVTRADRLLGHARWYAERIDRETFGAKPDISIQINNVTVDDTLGLQAAGLLDQLKTVSVQPSIAPQHIAPQQDELVVDNPESRI